MRKLGKDKSKSASVNIIIGEIGLELQQLN